MSHEIKLKVRAELVRCAVSGQFLTYTQFFNRLNPGLSMGAFPYTSHFNQIAMEERSHGYPDITFIVHKTGPSPQYPSQIDFRPADPADAQQLKSLRAGTDELIALYCPGTKNPY